VGEPGAVEFNPEPASIHDQKNDLRIMGDFDLADGETN